MTLLRNPPIGQLTTVERTVGVDFHPLLAHEADENGQASDSPENQLNALTPQKQNLFSTSKISFGTI